MQTVSFQVENFETHKLYMNISLDMWAPVHESSVGILLVEGQNHKVKILNPLHWSV